MHDKKKKRTTKIEYSTGGRGPVPIALVNIVTDPYSVLPVSCAKVEKYCALEQKPLITPPVDSARKPFSIERRDVFVSGCRADAY